MNTYSNLMKDAADNWPEDEAAGTFETLRDRMEDYAGDDEERQWAVDAFGRDVEHMLNVFRRTATDAVQAERDIARYEAALARHLASDSHTANVPFSPIYPSLSI